MSALLLPREYPLPVVLHADSLTKFSIAVFAAPLFHKGCEVVKSFGYVTTGAQKRRRCRYLHQIPPCNFDGFSCSPDRDAYSLRERTEE